MRKTIRATDYLTISTYVRALETTLLTEEQTEQLVTIPGMEEVYRILQNHGYPPLDAAHPEAMDAALSAMWAKELADLGGSVPAADCVDIFRLKYDYHNVKTLLKANAVGVNPKRMLTDSGRVPVETLRSVWERGGWSELPGMLAEAAGEGKAVLDTTHDPQLSDIVLDRWMYRDMVRTANASGSAFLRGYVAAQIDAANLRSIVRALRMGKNADFLADVPVGGGSIAPEVVWKAAEDGQGLTALYDSTRLEAAAEAGAEALKSGTLTEFEKLCDDAVTAYLAAARLIPFGEAPLVAYLVARETEYTNLHILLTGRMAGLPPAVIRSHLRKSCV